MCCKMDVNNKKRVFFKPTWKTYLIFCGLSVLTFTQILVFLVDDGMITKHSKQNSDIEHLYSEDLKWELLRRELKMVEMVNSSFYNHLLTLIGRRSVNQTLFLLKSNSKKNRELSFVQEMENFMNMSNGYKAGIKSSVESTPNIALSPAIPVTAKPSENSESDNRNLPNCTLDISELRGRENVNETYHGFNYLEKIFNDTEIGGRWRPKNCTASQRIAIIIPYRDRDVHLKLLLFNLIPKLRRQKVDYTFYLVEQGHGSNFNRGMVRNMGFMEARKQHNYDCYIFNDVDTLIENDINIYKCLQNKAYHMAGSVDIFNYTLPYGALVGGVLSFAEEFFVRTNGYSNFYFMWGAEDDDMWRRIHRARGSVKRPSRKTAYVRTLKHERDPKIWERVDMYHRVFPFAKKDGLNSLKYDVITVEKRKLFTWIYLKVNETYYHELLNKYEAERKAELEAKEKLKTTLKPNTTENQKNEKKRSTEDITVKTQEMANDKNVKEQGISKDKNVKASAQETVKEKKHENTKSYKR